MLRGKFITQEDYQKAIDTLDIEMVEEEEIKEDEGGEEEFKELLDSTMEYLVMHDKEELKELLGDFKEDDEYANDVLK